LFLGQALNGYLPASLPRELVFQEKFSRISCRFYSAFVGYSSRATFGFRGLLTRRSTAAAAAAQRRGGRELACCRAEFVAKFKITM